MGDPFLALRFAKAYARQHPTSVTMDQRFVDKINTILAAAQDDGHTLEVQPSQPTKSTARFTESPWQTSPEPPDQQTHYLSDKAKDHHTSDLSDSQHSLDDFSFDARPRPAH